MDVSVIWLALGLVWVLGFVFSLAHRRRVDRSQWIAWDGALGAEAEGYRGYTGEVLTGHADSAADMLAVAEARWAEAGAARPVLAGLFEVVPTFAAAARARLHEWSVASRVREALGPVPLAVLPLRGLRLAALCVLAAGHALVDRVTLSAGERFRLRLLVLRWGYGLLGLAARGGGRALARAPQPRVPRRARRRARVIVHDLRALADEALRSVRPLLALLSVARANDSRRHIHPTDR